MYICIYIHIYPNISIVIIRYNESGGAMSALVHVSSRFILFTCAHKPFDLRNPCRVSWSHHFSEAKLFHAAERIQKRTLVVSPLPQAASWSRGNAIGLAWSSAQCWGEIGRNAWICAIGAKQFQGNHLERVSLSLCVCMCVCVCFHFRTEEGSNSRNEPGDVRPMIAVQAGKEAIKA